MRRLEIGAPAKVNFGLRITGVREDGYHLIDSWFVPLDLADRLELRLDESAPRSVSLALSGGEGSAVPATSENLAVRAAEAFLERGGLDVGLEIDLEKRIPAGAGLGGGSSDAAAVLRGLTRCFPNALRAEALAELALELGADVPFFLDPRPSRVTGIGEHIEPVSGLPSLSVLLAKPANSLATAEVYGAWDAHEGALTRNAARPTMPLAFGAGLDSGALGELLENDLEAPAVRLCPRIANLQEQICSLGALAVGMSGSGSTVFGVFPDRGSAESAKRRSRWDATGGADGGVWARVSKTVASVAAKPE